MEGFVRELGIVWAKSDYRPFWPAVAHYNSDDALCGSVRVTLIDKISSVRYVKVVVPFDHSVEGLSFENEDLNWSVRVGLFLLKSSQSEMKYFLNRFHEIPVLGSRGEPKLNPYIEISSSDKLDESASVREKGLMNMSFEPTMSTTTGSRFAEHLVALLVCFLLFLFQSCLAL